MLQAQAAPRYLLIEEGLDGGLSITANIKEFAVTVKINK